MPRRRLAHVDARTKRIDAAIDYFGAGHSGVESRVERLAPRSANRARSRGDEPAWHARTTPPVGSIGYTGSYREPSADIVEVSVVSVLEARGPD